MQPGRVPKQANSIGRAAPWLALPMTEEEVRSFAASRIGHNTILCGPNNAGKTLLLKSLVSVWPSPCFIQADRINSLSELHTKTLEANFVDKLPHIKTIVLATHSHLF